MLVIKKPLCHLIVILTTFDNREALLESKISSTMKPHPQPPIISEQRTCTVGISAGPCR